MSAATGETKGNSNSALVPMLLGPLTGDIMRHPVTTSNGETYEAEQIQRWFAQGHTCDPITGEELVSTNLIPNNRLLQISEKYFTDMFSFQNLDTSQVYLPRQGRLKYADASEQQRAEAEAFFSQAGTALRGRNLLGLGQDKTAYFGWCNGLDVAIVHYRSRGADVAPEDCPT